MSASDATQTIEGALAVVQDVMEYLGTVAFAISGAVVAAEKRMDLVGVVVLGTVVSVGGGTMRDLLVGEPVFWVSSPTFVLVGALAALLAVQPQLEAFLARQDERFRVVQLSDAVGLALFVVAGTNVALNAGANSVAAALVGVVSGIGGGVVRDLLANRVPSVLTAGQLYASAALAGALLYVVLLELDVPPLGVFWIPVVVVFGLRVLSITTGVRVPILGHRPERGVADGAVAPDDPDDP